MKIKLPKVKGSAILNGTVTILGIVGTVLSAKAERDSRSAMKKEIMKEVLDEISKKQK